MSPNGNNQILNGNPLYKNPLYLLEKRVLYIGLTGRENKTASGKYNVYAKPVLLDRI